MDESPCLSVPTLVHDCTDESSLTSAGTGATTGEATGEAAGEATTGEEFELHHTRTVTAPWLNNPGEAAALTSFTSACSDESAARAAVHAKRTTAFPLSSAAACGMRRSTPIGEAPTRFHACRSVPTRTHLPPTSPSPFLKCRFTNDPSHPSLTARTTTTDQYTLHTTLSR